MSHDPNLTKRNLFVIPAALLIFYSLLTIVYAEGIRDASATTCPDSGEVSMSGVCYTVWKLAMVPMVLGLVLLVVGLAVFRDRPRSVEACLYPGTGVHTTLAILVSWVAITLLAVLVLQFREGLDDVVYTLTMDGKEYQLVFLLEILLLIELLAAVPFAGLLMQQSRMRRRLFRLLDVDDEQAHEAPALRLTQAGRPHPGLKPAPLRDVSGSEGSFVNLEEEP
ncbi:MAG TPA: hypothetical protein VI796_07055 [Candidatus Thermoplasmatota archaeon]|nr:hypothetical protein [Candidatus Thermoplasmatota archaeon]